MRSDCEYGSGRRSTPFTTLKIAVVAPMPSASVSAVTTKNPGLHANDRATNRTSRKNVSMSTSSCRVGPSNVRGNGHTRFDNRIRPQGCCRPSGGLAWGMNLVVNPPVLPMLANRVSELPPGEGWVFEPKWDGFRALVFRDGDETFIQSRDEKPLDRYFPEILGPLKAQLPEQC